MADYTYVHLTVLTVHAEQVKALYPDTMGDSEEFGVTTQFEMGEQRYGNLDGLEKLEAAGIPYDSNGDASYEQEESTEFLRFTPEGVVVKKTLYSSDNAINIDYLLPLLEDHLALKTKISEAEEARTVLPWDNQEAYGKLYRTHQLISPTTKQR